MYTFEQTTYSLNEKVGLGFWLYSVEGLGYLLNVITNTHATDNKSEDVRVSGSKLKMHFVQSI